MAPRTLAPIAADHTRAVTRTPIEYWRSALTARSNASRPEDLGYLPICETAWVKQDRHATCGPCVLFDRSMRRATLARTYCAVQAAAHGTLGWRHSRRGGCCRCGAAAHIPIQCPEHHRLRSETAKLLAAMRKILQGKSAQACMQAMRARVRSAVCP
jgi:hypothetical protein